MEKTTNFVEWFFYIFGYFGFPFIDFENLAKSELFFWLHVFKWFDGRTLEMKFECFDFWFKKCHYHFKMTWKIIYDHHHWNQATGVEVDQSAAEQYTNVHLIVGISSQQIQLECSSRAPYLFKYYEIYCAWGFDSSKRKTTFPLKLEVLWVTQKSVTEHLRTYSGFPCVVISTLTTVESQAFQLRSMEKMKRKKNLSKTSLEKIFGRLSEELT